MTWGVNCRHLPRYSAEREGRRFRSGDGPRGVTAVRGPLRRVFPMGEKFSRGRSWVDGRSSPFSTLTSRRVRLISFARPRFVSAGDGSAFFLSLPPASPRTTVITCIPAFETEMRTLTAELVNDASAAQLSGPPALLLIKLFCRMSVSVAAFGIGCAHVVR